MRKRSAERPVKINWRKYAILAASFLTITTLWGLASLSLGESIFGALLPSPTTVLIAVFNILEGRGVIIGGSAMYHVSLTLLRLGFGLALGMIIGTVLGLAASRGRLERLFDWPIIIGMSLPTLIIVLMFIAWFHAEDIAAVFAVAAATTPYVTVNIRDGAKSIDRGIIEMGHIYGANRKLMTWDIFIPNLTPYLFSAARYAFSLSWKVVTLAEAFGFSGGIGFAVYYNFWMFNQDLMLAWIVIFFMVAIVIEIALSLIEKRVMIWKPKITT